MKLSYYTTLDGADPLPKLGALVHTRVEKSPLGPVLAGPTTREGVFSDAKGRLFTRFEENACAPVDGAKPGALNVHDSLYYETLAHQRTKNFRGLYEADFSDMELRMAAQYTARFASDAKPDLSEAAIEAVCAAIFAKHGTTTGRISSAKPNLGAQYPQRAWGGLAIGESCAREEVEDGHVKLQPWYCVKTDPSTGRVTRTA